jgi:hypothetical protein
MVRGPQEFKQMSMEQRLKSPHGVNLLEIGRTSVYLFIIIFMPFVFKILNIIDQCCRNVFATFFTQVP